MFTCRIRKCNFIIVYMLCMYLSLIYIYIYSWFSSKKAYILGIFQKVPYFLFFSYNTLNLKILKNPSKVFFVNFFIIFQLLSCFDFTHLQCFSLTFKVIY